MSAEISPERLVDLVRSHWAIKNRLHWALDVVMDEDRMRNRTLRRAGVPRRNSAHRPDIVRLMDDDYPLKGRMEIAAVSDKYLLGMLANAVGKF